MPSDRVSAPTPNSEVAGDNLMRSACRAMGASSEQAKLAADQTATFIRTQPFAATLIALTIGYVLGRLRV